MRMTAAEEWTGKIAEEEVCMDERLWAQQTAQKIKDKMRMVAGRNRHKLPYTTGENGRYDDLSGENVGWWTNGFWGGMMWQLYRATGEKLYLEIALETEEKLDQALMSYHAMDHDSGFRWLPTAVADYKLTGSRASYNRARLAADNLAGRFNPAGKFIRAWNDEGDGSKAGWAIIDCMMNLPLLYWAYGETKDPRYYYIATSHADTVMQHFIRQDGSVKHIVEFNPVTGEYVRSHGGQGYGQGSSWTRGQGWALYGFTLSFLHTKQERYLAAARRVADYFLENIPESGLIPVDFRQPADCSWEDSTAAAIAACGLLELEKVAEGKAADQYHRAALTLLTALVQKRCSWSPDQDNIVEKCTAAYHDDRHEFAIIYGDYYLIEAIWKLTGEECSVWV